MPAYHRTVFPFLCSVVWCALGLPAVGQFIPPYDQWEPISKLSKVDAHLGRDPAGVVTEVVFPQPTTTDDDLRPLAAFPQLESVNLRHTSITDQGLLHLGTLANLKSLDLPPTITDDGLALIRGHGGLEHLILSGTGITDAGAQCLSQCRQLRTLVLLGTAITDAGMEDIVKCTKLESLVVPEQIHNEGLRHIHSLKHLVALDLNGANVTDDGLATLAELRNLEWLWAAPVFCTKGYESTGWVETAGFRLCGCCWSVGAAGAETAAAQPAANSAGVW